MLFQKVANLFSNFFGPPQQLRSWFKGADTTTLTKYLEDRYTQILADHPGHTHHAYLVSILSCLKASNKFFGTLYRAPLWLRERDREAVIDACSELLAGFTKLANYSFKKLKLCRWKFHPKFHMLSEIRYALLDNRAQGVRSLNPMAHSCQQDEDFIGKISQMSRTVSSRLVNTKTIQRYKLGLRAAWWLVCLSMQKYMNTCFCACHSVCCLLGV